MRNRIEDPALLKEIHGKPCFISSCKRPGEVHHIITKGRMGPDLPWNLIPFCPYHHRGEWHGKGVPFFIDKYPEILPELESRGFEWDDHFKKLYHKTWGRE